MRLEISQFHKQRVTFHTLPPHLQAIKPSKPCSRGTSVLAGVPSHLTVLSTNGFHRRKRIAVTPEDVGAPSPRLSVIVEKRRS